MPLEPGKLSDLEGDGQRAWTRLLKQYFNTTNSPHLLDKPNQRTTNPVTVDWGAYPVRIRSCLSRPEQAHRLLDWTTRTGDKGRDLYQEEYFEWRVVRDRNDRIVRIEMTTELPEYWETLAAYHPRKTLQLVESLAGEKPDTKDVYGRLDPFAASATPSKRRNAFASKMRYPGANWSPYNNGQKGLCFMSQEFNTLSAAILLVAYAAFPFVTRDSASSPWRKMTGPEAIATGTQSAVSCRNSDPTIVGACIGLAFDGRAFAFADPVGIYIINVDHSAIRKPDGSAVPRSWFRFSRGSRTGLPLSQRLVFQVPKSQGFTISDLIDSTTDKEIRYGGQIADLVQLGVHLRISDTDEITSQQQRHPLPDVVPCHRDPGCMQIKDSWEKFKEN
jgi:hypothetical protein